MRPRAIVALGLHAARSLTDMQVPHIAVRHPASVMTNEALDTEAQRIAVYLASEVTNSDAVTESGQRLDLPS